MCSCVQASFPIISFFFLSLSIDCSMDVSGDIGDDNFVVRPRWRCYGAAHQIRCVSRDFTFFGGHCYWYFMRRCVNGKCVERSNEI